MTLAPNTTTTVDLHVTRFLGSPTTSAQEIVVEATSSAPESMAATLGDTAASPGCGDGKVWATVHAQRFSAALKALRVTSHAGDTRAYEIEHAGVHATLTPGAALVDFASTPIQGDWLLRTPFCLGRRVERLRCLRT
jgi:hypothetical protein